jgi:hypothetical protein
MPPLRPQRAPDAPRRQRRSPQAVGRLHSEHAPRRRTGPGAFAIGIVVPRRRYQDVVEAVEREIASRQRATRRGTPRMGNAAKFAASLGAARARHAAE